MRTRKKYSKPFKRVLQKTCRAFPIITPRDDSLDPIKLSKKNGARIEAPLPTHSLPPYVLPYPLFNLVPNECQIPVPFGNI